MPFGDQWKCGCGWGNLFLRKRCRACGLPASLAVAQETAMELMAARRESPTGGRGPGGLPKAGDKR